MKYARKARMREVYSELIDDELCYRWFLQEDLQELLFRFYNRIMKANRTMKSYVISLRENEIYLRKHRDEN